VTIERALTGLTKSTSTGSAVYVEDVFSTDLYTGGSSTPTITNGIDLASKGGLVWIKGRKSGGSSTYNHQLVDSARGVTKILITENNSIGYDDNSSQNTFTSTGFTLNSDTASYRYLAGVSYVSWTFRKQPKFFDIVTYTGTGANRTIAHALGSTPGMIIVKRTDGGGEWLVYHRGLTSAAYVLGLNYDPQSVATTVWNSSPPTSSVFSVGTDAGVNASGGTYVAYLFAHDAGGFGASDTDSIITCGSYVGTLNQEINLGWEPQFLLVKDISGGTATSWYMYDNIRGFTSYAYNQNDPTLSPNLSTQETSSTLRGFYLSPNGLTLNGTGGGELNTVGNSYIYMAIRRGPMKTPTDATKVFMPVTYTGTNADRRSIDTTISPDMVLLRQRNDTVIKGMYTGSRMSGNENISTGFSSSYNTDSDSFMSIFIGGADNAFSLMNAISVGNDAIRKFNQSSTQHVLHAFKRAPGFFDVVHYQGNGLSSQTIKHNLGVVPELIIIKNKVSTSAGWSTLFDFTSTTRREMDLGYANQAGTVAYSSSVIISAKPTATTLFHSNGPDALGNQGGNPYLVYLFASCPGVSKVGSYTGNGSSQTIDCGFAAGARFVLIKRTDDTGDWPVWDTARGIVSGNDPRLSLYSSNAEVTTDDTIDPASSGFIVNQVTATNVNVSSATYLYLAIA
jgi:hypothetical protein